MASRSSSRRRRVALAPRKFIWARQQGSLTDAEPVANLLGAFQQEYGAQLLGSTVMRLRGYILPLDNGTAPYSAFGTVGAIVENDDDLTQTEQSYGPGARPHDDWMMWYPYYINAYTAEGAAVATASPGNSFAVDVKSARKIEELGQGLHLWRYTVTTGGPAVIQYHLSIGLKLP